MKPNKIILTQSGVTAFFTREDGSEFQIGTSLQDAGEVSAGFRDGLDEIYAFLHKWRIKCEKENGNLLDVPDATDEEKAAYEADNCKGTVRKRLSLIEDRIDLVERRLGIQ